MSRIEPVRVELMESRLMLSALPSVSIRCPSPVVTEGGRAIVFELRCRGRFAEAMHVNPESFATSTGTIELAGIDVNIELSGTARPGSDYVASRPLDAPIRITQGYRRGFSRARIIIHTSDADELAEGRETISLKVLAGDGYRVRTAHDTALATIRPSSRSSFLPFHQIRERMAACWPLVDPSLLDQADDIREAALRALVEPYQLVFVGLGYGPFRVLSLRDVRTGFPYSPVSEDPSDELIARLVQAGREVKKWSDARIVSESGSVFDAETNQRGALVLIGRISRLGHRGDALVDVTVYVDSTLQAERQMVVYQDEGVWHAVNYGVIWEPN